MEWTTSNVREKLNKMFSFRKKTALQGALVLAIMEDWNWKTIFYGHYGSVFNHCSVIGQQNYRIRWKTKQELLSHSRSFKVIEVGSNRKPVCDFILVINSNWHPYLVPFRSYSSLLFKFWTLCVFEPPFGGLVTTDDVHPGLIGKRVVDFLLVLIELFFAGCYGWD